MHPIIYANRDAIEGELIIVEGNLPADIFGVVYLISPVGSVNSKGLPVPPKKPDGMRNEEFGSPIMNGDGMVIKIDFNTPSKVYVKTAILKPPCYYADEATRYGSKIGENVLYKQYGFKNLGIARMSPFLGIRNALNTAFVPFQFRGDAKPRILATYDAGRPYEFSPDSLQMITPIGKNQEWITSVPDNIKPVLLLCNPPHTLFLTLIHKSSLLSIIHAHSKRCFM
jgi:carotenoid cleavage dioxygenase-like enzyme